MKKIGIFYGSTTGITQSAAENIASHLNVSADNVFDVGNTKTDCIDEYYILFLGSSTWGIGELQDDWYSFLDKLKTKNLSGKYIAIFGCGDGSSFGSSFCDAIGIIYNELQNTGCKFCGKIQPDDYTFDESMALIGGEFVGLPLDDVNEPELSDQRIKNWINSIRQEVDLI